MTGKYPVQARMLLDAKIWREFADFQRTRGKNQGRNANKFIDSAKTIEKMKNLIFFVAVFCSQFAALSIRNQAVIHREKSIKTKRFIQVH